MRRRLLIAGLAIIATASCLLAGPRGVVKTNDGETYEGEVTEKGEEVIVRVHGVDTVIARNRVASIDYTTYADRFKESLAALAADDVDGRLKLAREAFDRRDYENALRAAASALDIDPLDRDARQLESLISTQIELEGRRATTKATEETSEDDAGSGNPKRTPGKRPKGLDEAQANRIRQLELSASDNVRIQFRDNVRKRYVDSQPGMSYRAFASRSDVDQALTILSRGEEEMRDDVIIRSDPMAIESFGRRIQTALVQGCASSNCHGGTQAGDFRLISTAPDASTRITNFYLVTQYAKNVETPDQGMFTPPTLPLVDRANARNSLLYQYALPRTKAKHKHPLVRGWDGLFRDDDDRLARDFVQWMERDLARLQGDYGFTFTLEGGPSPSTRSATTGPTTEPTSMPEEQ